MKQLELLLVFLFILFDACDNTHSSWKLVFSESMQQEIMNKFHAGNILVYYHSGECSFCYGVLISLLSEFPDIPLLSITSSENRFIVDYHLEDIGFKGISIYDSMNIFFETNQDLLKKNNLFLIDSQYNILNQCENITEEFRKDIKEISNTHKKSIGY